MLGIYQLCLLHCIQGGYSNVVLDQYSMYEYPCLSAVIKCQDIVFMSRAIEPICFYFQKKPLAKYSYKLTYVLIGEKLTLDEIDQIMPFALKISPQVFLKDREHLIEIYIAHTSQMWYEDHIVHIPKGAILG